VQGAPASFGPAGTTGYRMTRMIRYATAMGLLCCSLWTAAAHAAEPALTVPAHLRPAIVPSAVPGVPAYVLVEAVFSQIVPAGEGLYLEFRPSADAAAGDARWHAMWFRPCEGAEVVEAFAAAALPPGQAVQVAIPVNPPELLRRQLTTKCQAGGYRTPAEADSYAASLFAANLQTLRGEDAGVYLGGSLNSLVRLGGPQNRSSINVETTTNAATTIHSAGGAAGASSSSSSKADSTSSASSSS